MHPVLFRIPLPGWELPVVGRAESLPLYSYGVMLGLSLVVGWYLTLGLCERDGLPRESMANCYVLTALAAVLFSRVLYVVTNPDEFHSLGDLFSFRQGGLVAYGGFIGGWLGSFAYLRWKKLPLLWEWADAAVPSLAAGLGITRVGCYLFGCDFGKPLDAAAPGFLKALGTFPRWPPDTVPGTPGSPAFDHHLKSIPPLVPPEATASLPVHPTQIYEALAGVLLLGLCLWARKHRRFPGQLALTFFYAYGAARFLIEVVRGDPERGSMPPSLDRHVLVPLGLALLAGAWALGLSRAVTELRLRRVTQLAAFVPALGAFLLLRPASFADVPAERMSTSQFIALLSALGAAALFTVWYPPEASGSRLQAPAEEKKKKRRRGKRVAE